MEKVTRIQADPRRSDLAELITPVERMEPSPQ